MRKDESKQNQAFIDVSGKLNANRCSIYFVIAFPNVTVYHRFSQ